MCVCVCVCDSTWYIKNPIVVVAINDVAFCVVLASLAQFLPLVLWDPMSFLFFHNTLIHPFLGVLILFLGIHLFLWSPAPAKWSESEERLVLQRK